MAALYRPTAYQALLELERSQEPFSEQILEAADILKIDLSAVTRLQLDSSRERVEEQLGFSGREEWVFRWLLKKLDTQGTGARLDPRAWSFMRSLVERMPVENAARLLNGHDFLRTLEQSLAAGLAEARAAGRSHTSLPGGLQDRIHDISDGSKSSSTAVGGSASGSPKQSRKRKRSHSLVEDNGRTVTPKRTGQGIDTLFSSIVSLLDRLVAMSKMSSNDESDLAGQYMAAVLRTDPDRAASLLTAALCAAEFLILDGKCSFLERSTIGSSPLAPFVSVWEYRSVSTDDLSGRASNEAFSSHCLTPGLLLLSACRERRDKHPAIESTKTVLEQLLARHIVLPSRSSFLAARDQGLAKSNGTGVPLLLIDALDSAHNNHLPEVTSNDSSNSDEKVLSTTPLIFEIAIRCIPRDSPRKRITEGPWLEGLFLYLMQKAHLPVFSDRSVTMSQQSYQLLEQLLQTAIDRRVSLDTSILRDIVRRFSGFLELDLEKDHTRWSLIGKILELDANVFLMPVEVEAGSLASPYGLMSTLFARITQTGRKIRSTITDDYRFLRSGIVLPLLREFAKARDLTAFLGYWRHELQAQEEFSLESDDELADSPPPTLISIWEDMELTTELSNLLESSLTPGQIDNVLYLTTPDFKASLKDGDDAAPRAYASAVIIDAVLGAIQREETKDLVSGIVEKFASIIIRSLDPNSDWPENHRWRLWRLATLINLRWCQTWSTALERLGEDMGWPNNPHVELALETIESLSVSSSWLDATPSNSNEFLEVMHAFQYVLSFDPLKFKRDAESARSADAIDQALDAIVPFLEDTLNEAQRGKAALRFQWDGRPESVISPGPLVVALATAILRFPRCLKYATEATRLSVLQRLYWLYEWQDSIPAQSSETVEEKPLMGVWEGLLECDDVLEDPTVLEIFIALLTARLRTGADPTAPSEDRDVSPDLPVRCLLGLPLTILRRRYREMILDDLLKHCLRTDHHSFRSSLTLWLALMARLMEVPNATSRLATDASALWELADVFSQSGSELDTEGLCAFEELVRRTFEHLIPTKDQDRSRKYLKKFHARLGKSLAEGGIPSDELGTNCLVKASLSVLWPHRGELLKPWKEKEITRLRRLHLDGLISDLVNNHGRPTQRTPIALKTNLLVTLDCMLEYGDLLGCHEQRAEVNSTLSELMNRMMPVEDGHIEATSNHLVTDRFVSQGLTISYSLSSCTQDDRGTDFKKQSLLLQLLRITTSADQQRLLVVYRENLRAITAEDRLTLLSEFQERGIDNPADADILRLLPILLSTVEDPGKDSVEPRTAISNVFVKLCGRLWQNPKYRQFCFVAQSMALVLRHKPWAMTQWGIENTVSAITITLSPSGPHLPPQHAIAVYEQLCALMSSMLAIHRTKLGGRYHLIIPLLQAMLRCVFTPDPKRTRNSQPISLPPWLSAREAKLDVSSAAAYARILTAICDPTVSSVTSSKRRARLELNDETKKAKATAGQYLHYLVMEYARCQLEARISPEVKEALMPGLYAVFDVMSMETMRTLNDAMDASGRAIFKGLYDDYRRFGKWNEV